MKSDHQLRVGLLLDSTTVPAWAWLMTRLIQESGCARVALVVLNQAQPHATLGRWWHSRSLPHLASMAYGMLDAWFFRQADGPFEPKDLGELLSGVPTLKVLPEQKRFSDYFKAEDVASMRAANLDVIVRLGFRLLKGEVLRTARHGVWSYHHGDNARVRGGPAGFWEVMEDHGAIGCIVQILNEEVDNGRVLYHSHSATHVFSVTRTLHVHYWKGAYFVPRLLRALADQRPPFDSPIPRKRVPAFYSGPMYRRPRNARAVGLVFRAGARLMARSLAARTTRLRWMPFIALAKPEGPVALADSLYRFKPVVPPGDCCWADPQAFEFEGRNYLFVEEWTEREPLGRIVVASLDARGAVDRVETVLKKDYHLSYPFVFRADGETFMVPECGNQRRVGLYRCVQFPDRWEPVTTLLQGKRAFDTTLCFHDGRWWMFTLLVEDGLPGHNDELFLFHSNKLVSDRWVPHPLNPVVSDVRSARPAGPLFRLDGDLYRPAQDCSVRYGRAVVVNRVTRLSESAFAEEPVSRIEPGWHRQIVGTHTLSADGRVTVVDACVLGKFDATR